MCENCGVFLLIKFLIMETPIKHCKYRLRRAAVVSFDILASDGSFIYKLTKIFTNTAKGFPSAIIVVFP